MNFADYLISHQVDTNNIGATAYGQKNAGVNSSFFEHKKTPFSIYIHERYGRFGNNLIQILNALICAKTLRTRFVSCCFNPISSQIHKVELATQQILFDATKPSTESAISGTFFYPSGFEICVRNFKAAQVKKLALTLRSKLLPPNSANNKACKRIGIHFRGGDVFAIGQPVPQTYVQPPLSYYIIALNHAIHALGSAEIVLVYGDEANPALSGLRSHLTANAIPFKNQTGSVEDDFQSLAECDAIIASVGTFSEVAALMNERLAHWYSFRAQCSHDEMRPFVQSRIGEILYAGGADVHIVRDVTNSYTAKGHWKASPEQIEMLIDYSIACLKIDSWRQRTRIRNLSISPFYDIFPKLRFNC